MALCLLMAALISACGTGGDAEADDVGQILTDSEPDTEGSDDEVVIESDEELAANRASSARSDLRLELDANSVSVEAGGSAAITAVVAAHERDFVRGPAVGVRLPNSVSIDASVGCEPYEPDSDDPTTWRCPVVTDISAEGDGQPMVSEPLTIVFLTSADTSAGAHPIELWAESKDNPPSNDPNDLDNFAILELVVD